MKLTCNLYITYGGVEGDGRNSKPLYYNTHYCEILLDVYLHARSFVFLSLHELHSKTSQKVCATRAYIKAGSPISGDEFSTHHPSPEMHPACSFRLFIN